MAKFIKHVGKQGDRKVAVIFRQVPGEEHMCLVVYTETLNQNIHDPMIACIESPEAQQQEHLGDALNKAYTRDGKQILQVLHREGMMKKVQTNQIMMTPAPNQHIKLEELNNLLNEMNKGEEAVKRLAEIDSSRGLQDPKDVARRVRENTKKTAPAAQTPFNPGDSFLGDGAIANSLREQAIRMATEAKGLLAESDRLLKEAANLEGARATPAAEAPVKRTRRRKTETAE
jgi:hypothetical protein